MINENLYFAAAFVANTGANAKTWAYYYGSHSFVKSKVAALNGRIVDLGTYKISGTRYYTAVVVRNTGGDARSWWWYLGVTSSYVQDRLSAHGARAIDVEYMGAPGYNVVMVRGPNMPRAWCYCDVTATTLVDKISKNKARLISLQRATTKFSVCMIDNSPKVQGSVVSFGTGCTGTRGKLYHHATGIPEIGNTLSYRLVNGAAVSISVLRLGVSKQYWGRFSLPLDLTIFGAPGCKVYTDSLVGFAAGTSWNGLAGVSLSIPNAGSLLGKRIFTQFMCLDRPANSLDFTFSNGLQTTIGGRT